MQHNVARKLASPLDPVIGVNAAQTLLGCSADELAEMKAHLQELQRQKKLEALNDGRQQNVMQQLCLMHHTQSSGTQYPLVNNGIPVRDASQMFMFGDTNLVQALSNRLAQNQALQSRGLASHQLDGTAMSNESVGFVNLRWRHGLGLQNV
ncbi:hypothetical protein L6452_27218 [Arctium lappa]|uniref:Uncharacterized protein n=1 Tax=Arctium lappa TaxID=4217 RepID=A0ACB8ZXD3_ARCLA|nr:hypothetical protein L6452_27218 [Arctium lappa]